MKLQALQTKMTSVALATVLGAAPALAIEINPTLDLTGYIVGSARYIDQDDGDATLDLDATQLLASIKTEPVSGTVSLYASGNGEDVSILDAYFTYDLGGGTSITAGKFLSYHGYEAFHIPNLLQITYSNANSEAIIPGYHKGIRIDTEQGNSKMGVAFLDSVYSSDGELDASYGLEGYYVYSADDITAYFGVAYESTNDTIDRDALMVNFWLQYVAGATTFAGEVAYKDTDRKKTDDIKSYFVSGLVQYEMSSGKYVVARLCYGSDDYDTFGEEKFLRATLAFRQKITDNFTVVEELSYTDFDNADSATFLGVQARFTF